MKSRRSNDPIRDLKANIAQLDRLITQWPRRLDNLPKQLRPGAERQMQKDITRRAELQAKLNALEPPQTETSEQPGS